MHTGSCVSSVHAKRQRGCTPPTRCKYIHVTLGKCHPWHLTVGYGNPHCCFVQYRRCMLPVNIKSAEEDKGCLLRRALCAKEGATEPPGMGSRRAGEAVRFGRRIARSCKQQGFQLFRTSCTRALSTGSSSCSNQGFCISQRRLRGEGWGRGRRSGAKSRQWRTVSVRVG